MDNREIDKLIAEKVMGFVWRRVHSERWMRANEGYRYLDKEPDNTDPLANGDEPVVDALSQAIPHYSTDIAAAKEIIEHFEGQDLTIATWKKPNQGWHAIIAKDKQWFLEDHESGMASMDVAEAATLPMAIALAALRACGVAIDSMV